MKKVICLVLCCAVAMLALAAAEEAEENVIAVVNGVAITNEKANAEYAYNVEYYAAYGITDEDSLAQMRQAIVDVYVQDEVMRQKAGELGISLLSDEDVALQSRAQYDETLFTFITEFGSDFYEGTGDPIAACAAFMDYYAAHSDLTVKDAIAAMEADYPEEKAVLDVIVEGVEAYFDENAFTLEAIETYVRQNDRDDAIFNYIASSVEITDEDVRGYYDELVSADQATYTDDPASLEMASSYGTVLYVPEGYRYIKHILVLMSEDDQNAMYTYTTSAQGYEQQLEALQDVTPMDGDTYSALSERKSEIEARVAEIDALLEDEEADIDALTEERDALTAEMGDVEGQLSSDEAARYVAETGLANARVKIEEIQQKYQPRIDEIYTRLENGEDFDTLILELGEDPGMLDESGQAVKPYMVYENTDGVWEENFALAAVSLNEGEYTPEAVWTSYGAHIVLYDSAVPAGPVDFESVKDSLTGEYTESRQGEIYAQQIDQWMSEAEITTWPDHLSLD